MILGLFVVISNNSLALALFPLTAPRCGDVIDADAALISWDAFDQSVDILVDGQIIATTAPAIPQSVSFTGLVEGAHTISVSSPSRGHGQRAAALHIASEKNLPLDVVVFIFAPATLHAAAPSDWFLSCAAAAMWKQKAETFMAAMSQVKRCIS